MSDQLETALTRTLSGAAERGPDPRPGLLDEVEGRFRRRRRTRYAAVAGVAAFAVVAGSAIAAGVLTTPGTPPGPDVVGVPAAAPGDEPPVADVWPEAYHKLPTRLADGRSYSVEGMIDDHRLLILMNAGAEDASELWALDLKTNKAHRLVRLPAPADGHDHYASHFTIGSGHIVWWELYTRRGEQFTKIWKAPVTGGDPTLVGDVAGGYGVSSAIGDRFVVHDENIYFSSGNEGGVRKVPLAGGEATAVPDTDGYHIVQWPWLGQPGGRLANASACDDSTEQPCRSSEDLAKSRTFTTLKNVETGDVRDADVGDLESVVCGLTYCLGLVDGSAVARTRDGSDTVRLPTDGGPGMMSPPAWDRFVVVVPTVRDRSPELFDIRSGTSGSLGIKANDGSMTIPSSGPADQRWIVWSTDDDTTYHLLDLAAIK
ncbi:MAG: hypothetical protein ACRDTU_08825 [Micromonosporaceae bacterium]